MNQDKMKCPICDQYIAKELTKEIQCSTVCMNCFLEMVLDKRKSFRVGGDILIVNCTKLN
jgi:hypothetical protein